MIGGRDQAEAQRALQKAAISRVLDGNSAGFIIVAELQGSLIQGHLVGSRIPITNPAHFNDLVHAALIGLADYVKGTKKGWTELRAKFGAEGP